MFEKYRRDCAFGDFFPLWRMALYIAMKLTDIYVIQIRLLKLSIFLPQSIHEPRTYVHEKVEVEEGRIKAVSHKWLLPQVIPIKHKTFCKISEM